MAVEFNHTIVWSRDADASATFLADILGLPGPTSFARFRVVTTANDVSIDFADRDGEIPSQHYAFLVSEAEFDPIFGRIKELGLVYWADPTRKKQNEINHNHGGRGFYFEDPSGHLLEVITRAYGS